MQEIVGNLFTQKCDAICITTNKTLRKNGNGIMGAGVARSARNRWPQLEEILGWAIRTQLDGRSTFVLANKYEWQLRPPYAIVSLPTKHNWRENSDLNLIENSIKSLVKITNERGWNRVSMSRIGCGNGHLDWYTQVKPLLKKYLDDRFCVIMPER